MVRNIILYNAVKKLRIEGRSYSEISAELHVSKGTVSGWLSKVKWSVKTKSLLIAQNNKYSAKRIILMNKQKSKQKLERHVQYCQEAKKEYKHLRKSSLFLVGLAIYWGEGEKALKNGRVSVINSDVNILQIVVDFYEKILNIPDKKIRAAMFIYKDIDPDKALLYWSKNLKIPREQFVKTQVLPSRSHHAKKKVVYGMCSVYFSSTETIVKMLEWIRLLMFDVRV